jgi:hypothetical protein
VAPPRHTSPTATVGPIDVETAHAPWPAITVSAGQPNNQGAFRATIPVHIGGLTSAAANGERFDLTGDSGLYCGNTNATGGWDNSPNGIDPADPLTFTDDRTQLFGDGCVMRVQLVQHEASGTSVFGAGTSSNVAVSSPFSIDAPELVGVGGNDFAASWDGVSGGQSQIAVRYTGGNPLIGLFAGHWSLAVTDPDGTSCGGYSGAGSLADVAVDQACVDADGASNGNWHVAVSFAYLGAPKGPYDTTLSGPPPTYHKPQCDVQSAQLSATWGGTAASPTVQIGVKPNASIQDCSGWTYTVVGPTTANCGTGSGAPPTEIAVTCADAPAPTGWSVAVTYTDATGTTQATTIASIDGPVPP